MKYVVLCLSLAKVSCFFPQHLELVILLNCFCTGAFVGCSLEGSIVTTRALENSRFYGSTSICASDILLGSLPRPPAAASLYNALADLFKKH